MPDDLLMGLLLRWEESREKGEHLSEEQLCPENPVLANELRRRINWLRARRPSRWGKRIALKP
jgi:hypothetical protein